MNIFYLFLVAGVVIIFFILRYEKKNSKKVNSIMKANKNVPPLFMLRSAEVKLNAIKSALNTPEEFVLERHEFKKAASKQLDQLIENYNSQQIALSAYYAKLGALLISLNQIKEKTSAA
jgi:uncharacterized membrane-anchored protein YhcB (DUF1043 family)